MSIKCIDGGQLLLDFGYEKEHHKRDTFSITEQTGFLTPMQQISRMMAAGVNLMEFRREMYDFPDGNVPDDVSPDPTQKLGFDLADASEILRSVENSKGSVSVKLQEPSVENSKGSVSVKLQEPSIEGPGEKSTVSPDTVVEAEK